MAVVKPKRQGPSMDMTAMCDVAFLLLTFFILTTQFKGQSNIEIDTPSSISTQKVEETGMAVINVANDGKYFFSMVDPNMKLAALEGMSTKYGISFSDAQKSAFLGLTDIGVPLNQLGSYLALSKEQKAKLVLPGVPNDSTDSELVQWVIAAAPKEDKLAIKGDVKSKYPAIKKLLDEMTKYKINKFKLVTDSENKPVN